MGYVTKQVDGTKIDFSTEDLSIIIYFNESTKQPPEELDILSSKMNAIIRYGGLTKSDYLKFLKPIIDETIESFPQIMEDFHQGKTIGTEFKEDGLIVMRSGTKIFKSSNIKALPGGKEIMNEFLTSMRKKVLKN